MMSLDLDASAPEVGPSKLNHAEPGTEAAPSDSKNFLEQFQLL